VLVHAGTTSETRAAFSKMSACALRIDDPDDVRLLQAIACGEFA
jgi:hypothetical protein